VCVCVCVAPPLREERERERVVGDCLVYSSSVARLVDYNMLRSHVKKERMWEKLQWVSTLDYTAQTN
jgi:hypothetical protein